jgi:Zn-dependent M16 (insulinase) family peptidase
MDCNRKVLIIVIVIVRYLCAMEGAFWKQIRGLGLSYSYSMRFVVEEGRLYFSLFKSTDPVKAYEVATKIVTDLLTKQVRSGASCGTLLCLLLITLILLVFLVLDPCG